MNTRSHLVHHTPTPEEMQAIIRRAHLERLEAIRGFFRAVIWRNNAGAEAPEQHPPHDAVVCR